MEKNENNTNTLNFTAAENNIRKKWLFWSTLLPALVLVCAVSISVLGAFISLDVISILLILFSFGVSLAFFYMNYQYIFKKPGTTLLFMEMIWFGPLNLLLTFFNPERASFPYNLVTNFFSPQVFSWIKPSAGFSLLMLILVVFESIFFYYSCKLLQINKEMKEKRLIASPVYKHAMAFFVHAHTLEELDDKYAQLKTSEDAEDQSTLTQAYTRCKKSLKLATSRGSNNYRTT